MGGGGEGESEKIEFVLVHGASHGGWCWYKLITLLESAGFKATAVDLTAAGIDLTDPNTVFEPQHYNTPLFSYLSALPPLHKVILVGHSAAGGTLTRALCSFPHKISLAVYLAADMIQPGSLSSAQYHHLHHLHLEEDEAIWDYTYGEGPDKPPTSIIMKKQFIRQFYYNQSPPEDSTLASKLLRPVPSRPLETMNMLPPTPEVEKVPRVFIKTAKDNLFDPSRQDDMVKLWPPSQFYVLEESDHSAFFSVPTAVFACLVRAVSFLES